MKRNKLLAALLLTTITLSGFALTGCGQENANIGSIDNTIGKADEKNKNTKSDMNIWEKYYGYEYPIWFQFAYTELEDDQAQLDIKETDEYFEIKGTLYSPEVLPMDLKGTRFSTPTTTYSLVEKIEHGNGREK